MFTKLKKKKEKESLISFRSIKKYEDIIAYLKSIDQYYSKPYSLNEIKKILQINKTVSVYFTYKSKKYVIDHIVINSTLLKINTYYLNKKQQKSLNDIFTNTTLFDCALKDDWDNVKIKIMLGDDDQQVL